ncbi:MAG: sarcosine oxidase subunit gamma [Rhodobacteraceae bacterium]|nr:sarcosine oxidase subunit gamma [Paracoccaceae bacterium]PHR54765.1 MAG: sarcosine oxidase subunit gamma [Robiginitomaculum sp.]
MHDLAPLTALGADAPLHETIGAVTLTEQPDFALASLSARRGCEKEAAIALRKIIGHAAPAPGRSTNSQGLVAFWVGPAQWFVEAPYNSHEHIADELKAAGGDAVSVTEQTGGWARFDLSGETATEVLARLCPLDAPQMQSGAATRTSIEHTGCFVICREALRAFSIWVPRSSAGSVSHAIETAMRSIA